MNKASMATLRAYSTVKEIEEGKNVFKELRTIEKETPFAIALLYKMGVVEGKRQERARRKGGAIE